MRERNKNTTYENNVIGRMIVIFTESEPFITKKLKRDSTKTSQLVHREYANVCVCVFITDLKRTQFFGMAWHDYNRWA